VLTVSAVVPATDAPATLDRCRAALAATERGPDEVIVIEGPAELSAAAARNAGANRASGDVLVFVDADVEVHRDALARIRNAFEDDPGLVALFGSYDDAPCAPGHVSVFRNLLHHHVHHRSAGPAETFWTGLGAIRREVFADLGGFDAGRYRHASIEDIELGDRLSRRGQRIVLDPAIQGTHLKAWTLRSMLWTDFARRGVPWVALQVRNRHLSATLNLGWRHRVSALASVVALAAVLRRRPGAAALALGAFVGLNLAFYRVLWRRAGGLGAAIGVGLHGLHHLVGIAAVPAGVVGAVTRPAVQRVPGLPR
jgi:GT2 family glycosyltransferase